MATKFTNDDIAHIAKLASIPVTDDEQKKLAEGFTTTIAVVEKLNEINVSDAKIAHMTGLQNVWREDMVDQGRMFTQQEATANAKKVHDGYFVVDQIIDQDE